MDRIGNSVNSLRIQDSRHELSKNPPVLPSNWDPNKYPPVLATDQKILDQKVSTIHPPPPPPPPLGARFKPNQKVSGIPPGPPPSPPPIRTLFKPTDVRPENEGSCFGSDSSSSTSSRASSIAYSSCLSRNSSAGRSFSTTSSLSSVRADHSSPERDVVSLGGSNKKPHQSPLVTYPLVTYDKEPLYENCLEHENKERRVVVRNLKGAKAFSHHQQMESDKRLWVEHNLATEQRQIERDGDAKRGKLRPRAGKKAKSVVTQVRPDLSCTQASSDVEHTSVLEACDETPRSTGTSCDSGPSYHPETPDIILDHRVVCRSVTTCSNMGSQTDSASSEDATDWEDDSDLEDSSNILQFRLPSLLEGQPETGLSLLQIELSPMKSRLIEKLMLDFWAIFDSSWPHTMRKHCSSGQFTVSTTASRSGTTSRDSSSVRYGKRCRSDDGEDEESDDQHERRRKRAPVDKLPAVREDDPAARQFACPFRKHDPRKYSIQKWPRCAEKPQKTIARLKAHLYQYHLIEQCPRCKSVFESEDALEAHNMGQERCEAKTDEQVDGMTRKMKDQIQCRRKPHPGQTDGEKWEQIYKILFPNEAVPDPYFEPVPDHDMQRPQSPDSVNIAHYEEYLRRVLPGFVRNALEAAVNGELQPIETQLQRRMMDIIQEAQNQAFISFRDIRRSDSSIRSPSRPRTDMTSPADGQPQTGIETFFQAPPPANPVSFSDLSGLWISQNNAGQNECSDSGYGSRPSLSTTSQHASSEMLKRDTALSSSNCDQMQITSDIPMDSSIFDVTHLLNFDGIDDVSPTDCNWLDMPQSPPNLHHMGTSEPGFSGLANHHSSLPDQHMHKNDSAAFEEPGYPDPDLMELNFFDCDNERETRSA